VDDHFAAQGVGKVKEEPMPGKHDLFIPDFAGIMEKECHQKKEKGLLAGKLWLNKEHNVPKEAHLFGEEFYEYHPQFLPRSRSL
jgi:hypothetical protein